MQRSLEARVERLEQEAATAEAVTVICASFNPGELRGYRAMTGAETIRTPGEGDWELLKRAEQAHGSRNGIRTLREIRGAQ